MKGMMKKSKPIKKIKKKKKRLKKKRKEKKIWVVDSLVVVDQEKLKLLRVMKMIIINRIARRRKI